MRQKAISLALLLALATVYLLPRTFWLGQYVTADEPTWMERSANFYTALRLGDYDGTYQSGHPGVTAMWAGTLGILARFPDFFEETQARERFHFDFHLPEFGFSPLQLLAAARFFVLLGHTCIFLGIFHYLRRLFGAPAALLMAAFVAFDPFLFAHSRFLHAETFLPDTLFLSLLAWMAHLEGRARRDALMAGAAFGLAMLSKAPAALLLPALLLAGLLAVRQSRGGARPFTGKGLLAATALAGAAALAVMAALWPAMWADPPGTLQKMAANTLAYSNAEEYTSTAFYNSQVFADGRIGAGYPFFYPVTFLWRTTPAVLFGLALAGWAVFSPFWQRDEKRRAFLLLLYPLLVMLILIPTTKKLDRYAIPIYPPLDALAALGWVFAFERLRARADWLRPRWAPAAGAALLIGTQVLAVASTAPYYLSYYNPLLGGAARAPQVMMVGWGEGLDEAARYLNGQPNSASLQVASWYPAAFNYHFNGKAVTIPIQIQSAGPPAWLLDQDYLVIYIHQWQRQASWPLLTYLAGFEPEHVVVINGIEYVRIYNPRAMTPSP